MDGRYNTERMLVLRKLTRAISDLLRGQMKEYLSTLSPLLRPKAALGDYVQGSTKDIVKGADKSFKEMQALYESVAGAKPFNLSKELKAPVEVISSTLDITPMEYTYVASAGRESKTVIVTSPLKWVLNYSGFAPARMSELLADRGRDVNELQRFVLHYLVMHTVVSKQAGVSAILDALRFPISSGRSPEFGNLPITYISSSISTIRPPDEVIIENTEVSGMDAFEELVNLEDIAKMRDPLKDQLMEIVNSYGEGLS